jgi:hypothetical protein
MTVNPDLVSPCGLYCGVCAIYIAHRDNNQKFKERLVNLYKGEVSGKGILPNCENLSIEDIKCRGCLTVYALPTVRDQGLHQEKGLHRMSSVR